MKSSAIFRILFIIGFVIVDFVSAAEKEVKENPENINKKCMKKTGATVAEIELLEKGDFSKMKKPSEHLECYVKCVMDHTEILEEEKIKESEIEKKFSKKIPKAELEKAMKICQHFKGKDHCNAAFNMAKCYAENNVKLL